MKKINNKYILGIFTGILLSYISVEAANFYLAKDISYTTKNDKNVKNVAEALDKLYDSCDNVLKLDDELLTASKHNLSVEDVLTSSIALKSIISNDDSLNLLINNYNKYGSIIVNNKSSMEVIAETENVLDKFLANSEWLSAILKSKNAIDALDASNPITVPIMTSNNAPSGEAFASSEYSSSYEAYKAFDGNNNNYWSVGSGLSYKNQYLGYDFKKEIWVYKMDIKFYTGKQNTDFVVEATNTKNGDWTIIKSGLHESSKKQTIIMDNYNQKYRYYRIRLLSNISQSGDGNTVITILQFYGK